MARIAILNVEVDNIGMNEAVAAIDRFIQKREPSNVVTPNLDHIVALENDEEFQRVYKDAALVLTDGQPLIWYSKLKRMPIVEKVSGSDLFPEVCKMCAQKGYSVFLFGAAEGVAERVAEKLKEKYPSLIVAGIASPVYGFEKDAKQTDEYVQLIRAAKPDVLALALGTPKSEKFAYHHKEEMGVPVILNIGATFDFLAGRIRRAPLWMSKCGLEWLYRVSQDPRRLIKRYWKDIKMVIPLMWKYRKRNK